jgi:hypothetical protein
MRSSSITTITGLLLLAATAMAQMPAIESSSGAIRPPIVLDIHAALRNDAGDYEIAVEEGSLRIADRRSGIVLVSIIEQSRSELALEGVVGSLVGTDRETRGRVAREIESFNGRSPVGTMRIDERTGRIVLSHHLDPLGISAAEIARLAIRLARIAREESLLIRRMTLRV